MKDITSFFGETDETIGGINEASSVFGTDAELKRDADDPDLFEKASEFVTKSDESAKRNIFLEGEIVSLPIC